MAFLTRVVNIFGAETFLQNDPWRHCLLTRIANFSTFAAEALLSEENKKLCKERFKKIGTLTKFKTSSQKPPRKAAVLVPVCIVGDEPALLYTLRTCEVNRHRGQVSFPGGMYDESDKLIEQTALRETNEELGIPINRVEIWCKGHEILMRGIIITPVIGYLGSINVDTLAINKSEVEYAFSVSIRHLCDPSNFRYTQFTDGISTPVFLKAKCRIWGVTAMITHMFLTALSPQQYTNSLKFIKPWKR